MNGYDVPRHCIDEDDPCDAWVVSGVCNEKLHDKEKAIEKPVVADLEAAVNERWGTEQWDWTIGKCPEGWFYYCGMQSSGCRQRWAHKGYAPTLTDVLQAMLDIDDKEVLRDGMA